MSVRHVMANLPINCHLEVLFLFNLLVKGVDVDFLTFEIENEKEHLNTSILFFIERVSDMELLARNTNYVEL